jgi:hypothetical protein
MRELLIVWLLFAMNMMHPPHQSQFIPEAKESYVQEAERRREIVSAIVDRSFDPTAPSLFKGDTGRSASAMFLLVKMYAESGFRRDVHLGLGREKYAKTGLNDSGRSWCLGQIMLGLKTVPWNGQWATDSATTTDEGWTGRDLVGDTNKCVTATLRVLKRSFDACKKLPPDQRLAAYAAGTCESEKGQKISEIRFRAYRHWWRTTIGRRPTGTDVHIMAVMQKELEEKLKKEQEEQEEREGAATPLETARTE